MKMITMKKRMSRMTKSLDMIKGDILMLGQYISLMEENKMEKIDRHFLECIFGKNPEIEDLKGAIDSLKEWIIEIENT